MKRCPKCAEKIQDKALVCRFCGADQPKRASNWPTIGVAAAVVGALYIASLAGERQKAEVIDRVATKPSVPGGQCKGRNGESWNLSGLVKQRLRNPDSFQHVQTTYGPVGNGAMVATMKYRATNGFGAIDTYVAVGEVQASDCKARVITTE